MGSIYCKFLATGSCNTPNHCHSRSVTDEANVVAVLVTSSNSPHVSINQIA